MDHPTDNPPLPNLPTKPPESATMSTVTTRPVPSTSNEPALTSSETGPTDPTSSSAQRPTSTRPEPTSAPAEPSRSDSPPPPPPPPSSSAEPIATSSAEPTSTQVTSIDLPTNSEPPSTLTSSEPMPTTFITSPTISSSPLASPTSATPTMPVISTSGLSTSAKLGIGIGVGAVGILVLVMWLLHWLNGRRQTREENRKRVQESLEHDAQINVSQMSQPEPAVLKRRESALFENHPTRFRDVEQESVQHLQRYKPYSRESGYRGW
ncbi:hypothetical protein PMIN01_06992 [Paraphaeosphaeria minitans]|uniref:Uncharacterized protein n=1 Tax=Paraphaeosphaeria minitans TaxID=565426 RepID=A0A9P6GH28_9PLEO|nr:hypothetical protein PMIN01_06992 [Paraphaeosphaeria minitans]